MYIVWKSYKQYKDYLPEFINMYKLLHIITIVAFSLLASGCSHPSLYQELGNQLKEMPGHNARVEDVSMLLGTPPKGCKPVESARPLIGILCDNKEPMVISVTPNSPAYQAGIHPGDRIISINNHNIVNAAQFLETLRTNAVEGEPLHIVTNKGSLVVVPKVQKAEQCYWELQADQVTNSSGVAAGSGGSAYQRFFRTSCRVNNGFLSKCKTNWQE
jgi:membrane-associated protease RseP (regulator of RpoE activity)